MLVIDADTQAHRMGSHLRLYARQHQQAVVLLINAKRCVRTLQWRKHLGSIRASVIDSHHPLFSNSTNSSACGTLQYS